MEAVLNEIKSVSSKIDENKGAIERRFEEAKKLADQANEKLEAEVKQLNEDLQKKGATLEEIQTQVKEMVAKSGRFKTAENSEVKATREIISESIAEHFNEIKNVSKGRRVEFETKVVGNMTASGNLTGSVVATYGPSPATRGRRKVHFRDLVQTIQSATGVWKFYRQDNPAGEGSFSNQTTHGAAKTQVDYDLTEVTVTTQYLAGFVRFAKQMAQDLPFLQTFIANELVEDYKRQESFEFFGSLRSAATGSTTAGASVYAEKLIQYIANLLNADYDPNGIVTTSANWATLMTTKPSDYSVPGGVTISPTGEVMVVGIPVYVANDTYLGTSSQKTLVGDFSKAAIIQAEGLSTQFFEQDSDNVQKNLITARTEARVALATLRPDAFIYA